MLSKYAQELMLYLSPVTWKTTLELINEMRETREREQQFSLFSRFIALFSLILAEILRDPSIGGVGITLDSLEKQGLIESRLRDDPPHKLIIRSGRPRREWRLTQEGWRVRSELPEKEAARDSSLVPQPA